MPWVSIIEDIRERFQAMAEHPKVEIVQRGSERRVTLPYAPLLVHDGLARRREPRDRIGVKPRLADGGKELRSITLEALIARKDHQESVEDLLTELERIAEELKPVKFRNYGPAEDGWYALSSLSISDIQRQQGTNLRTRATAAMTFTEDPDVDVKVGPASGGHDKSKGDKGRDRRAGGWPKSYVVKSGDTLSAISIRFYDEAGGWRRIAEANGIRDPRTLAAGKKLKIPRPS